VTPGEQVSSYNARDARYAHYELRMECSGRRYDRARIYLGGARLRVTDPEPPTPPTFAHVGGPPAWIAAGSVTTTGTSSDPGLGVQSFTMTKPSGASETKTVSVKPMDPEGPSNPPCAGTRQAPCPPSAPASFAYPTADLPEGEGSGAARRASPVAARGCSRPLCGALSRVGSGAG